MTLKVKMRRLWGWFPTTVHTGSGFWEDKWLLRTLKQTKREKGRVTITIPHEIMVRSQPQIPIPGSDSESAAKFRKITELLRLRSSVMVEVLHTE